MKIEIESVEEDRMFDVRLGDKTSGPLTFDEMLGLISALTMPEKRPCLCWLKTEEKHKASLIKLEDIDTILNN